MKEEGQQHNNTVDDVDDERVRRQLEEDKGKEEDKERKTAREERDVGEFYSLLNEQMERLLYKVPPAAPSADNKEGAKK